MRKYIFGENFNRTHIQKLVEMKKHYVGEVTNNQHKASISEAADNLQTANLLKQSLMIVDELAKINPNDLLEMDDAEFDFESLAKLVKKAKELKKHRLWKLS